MFRKPAFEISTKSQASKKQTIFKTRNSKFQTKSFWSFEIGASNLFGMWDLEIGI